jgi:tellurite resistance protein
MRVKQLNGDERVMLCALVQQIVAADGRLSEEEVDAMDFLSDEMGEEAWQRAFDTAFARVRGLRGLLRLAREVNRRPARELIHHMAVLVADSDGIAPEEQFILDAMSERWLIGATVDSQKLNATVRLRAPSR